MDKTYLLLLTILLQLPSLVDNFRVKEVCQGTNNGITVVEDLPENRVASLRNRYDGCKYVDGNLEITGLDHDDFYDKDLSFLNSIQEVTGYVLIANVYVKNVTLASLTLIRGDTLFKPPVQVHINGTANSTQGAQQRQSKGYALFVSLNFKASSNAIGMRLLGLRSLTEISKGDILFENNNLLCYATTDIYWPDILANRTLQHVRVSNDIISSMKPCEPGCHHTCSVKIPEVNPAPVSEYCWGPGPYNCQKMNKVSCSSDCKNRCYGSGVGQCCNEHCAGGCDGPMSTDCWGCKDFYNDGGCVKFCPPSKIYDAVNYAWVPNPNRKNTFGKLCVTHCPRGFLEHNSGCVRTCPEGYEPKDDRTCQPCDGICAKRCRLNWPLDVDYVHANNIDSLQGCTIIDGHIRILQTTIDGDTYKDVPPMPLEKLHILKSIKQISEYLLVQFVNHTKVTSLDFLSNLEKIQGQDQEQNGGSLNIMRNPYLVSLGLTSLQAINDGLVIIQHNPKLCFVSSLKWRKLRLENTNFIADNANQSTYCEPLGLVCDSECKNGCWGAGNTQCQACRNAEYGDHCIPDCRRELLFQQPGEKQCQDCHPQCKTSCTGPTAADCDSCKKYVDGLNCVDKCPNDPETGVYKYNATNGTCQQCHSNCIEGCTGPGNFIGDGGCSKCEVSVADDDTTKIIECLQPHEECPPGYYPDTNPREPLQFLKYYKVCTKCHKECAECDSRGNYRCLKCKHYRNEDSTCVANCSTVTYTDTETNTCRACHSTCRRECTGPSEWDCNNCAHFKVFNDSRPVVLPIAQVYTTKVNLSYSAGFEDDSVTVNVTSEENVIITSTESHIQPFYCTAQKSCPADKPVPEQDGMDTVCQEMEETTSDANSTPSLVNDIIIGAVCGSVGLIVLLVCTVCCYLKRKDRIENRKLKWTRILTGDLEPPTSTAAPDMSKLRLVKEGELRRGGILGSGAFGTVYRGVWLPEGENVKIPVAIKVLQDGNSPNHNKELLEEARVMASVEHPCCVRIVAVCMTEQIMLVTQLMYLGCLLDYVKKFRDSICSKVMLNWCTQIARGMQYLESKGVVHRDLAARNVLVQKPNQVKITDFGLAKLLDYGEGEYTSAGGKMPIKWLALESIQHRKFTHKTDVWSYGVTLWEMFTYGQKPYENNRAMEVPELLEKGERLPQPTICTIDVYMIMIKCWMIDADSRPGFSELTDEFAKMARDPGRYLVIKGDTLMRLPSSSIDARDMLRNSSVAEDGPEEFMEADDYLHTGDSLDLSTADMAAEGQLDENGSTVIDMGDNLGSAYRLRNGSLNSRPRDNLNGLRSSTYPRRLGHVYMNGFVPSNGSIPLIADDSVNPSRESLSGTQDRRRPGHILNGGSHTSMNSIKPLKYTSSTRIEELEQENQQGVIEPPDYEDITQGNNPVTKSNSMNNRKHPAVYEDDYLQPRSRVNRHLQNSHQYINVDLPDHQAPPTPTSAPPMKDKAAAVFTYELSDLDAGGDKNNFGNPEYFDTNEEADDGISSDELEDLETNLCDPLLPHSNKDYYNSVAAFGSDSSARDSFVST